MEPGITLKSRMELIVGLVVLSWLSSGAAEYPTNAWGPVTNNTRVALVVKGGISRIPMTKPFLLTMRVQNLSTNETIFVFRTGAPERDPTRIFRILTPSGKDALPRDPQGYSGSGVSVPILPNETKEFDFDVRKMCKLH